MLATPSRKLLSFATAGSTSVARRFAFTKKLLDGLPLPTNGQRAYCYDANTRGLTIAVSPAGKKVFVLYRKVAGRPERITIGPYPDLSIEQARKKADELNGEIARGENPGQRRRTLRDEDTVAELFAQYIADRREHSKRTCDHMESLYHHYLHPLRLRKISAVTRQDCTQLHASIGRNHGKILANRALELLRTMFNFAIKQREWDGRNPASGVSSYTERARERFLEPQEFPAFFQALQAEPNELIRDFLLLCLLTGARRSNVQAMRWKEIDFSLGTWRIPDTKSGESVTLPLSPVALEILETRKASAVSEWAFPGTGRSGHLEEPKKAWQRILKRAGIQNLHIHDLRRTLGSWQAAAGSSLLVIGKSLGHKSLSATQIYARLNLDPVRESVNRATNAMMLAAKNQPALLEGLK